MHKIHLTTETTICIYRNPRTHADTILDFCVGVCMVILFNGLLCSFSFMFAVKTCSFTCKDWYEEQQVLTQHGNATYLPTNHFFIVCIPVQFTPDIRRFQYNSEKASNGEWIRYSPLGIISSQTLCFKNLSQMLHVWYIYHYLPTFGWFYGTFTYIWYHLG